MFFTIYKITNLINGKIYVGAHKTSDLDDDYMGSGKLIKMAIEKYGLENFKKEYISIFDNENEMYKMESTIVDDAYLKNEDTYNLKKGGNGGWSKINDNYPIEKRKEIGKKFGSKAGSWKNKQKRIEILNKIPLEKRKMIGKKLGDKYGGLNELSIDEVEKRLKCIEDIDLKKYGWVSEVSNRLGLTHTQVKRFIDKYYKGEYYRRKK